MKRYLVTLTGRANCIYGKLRGNELVCSYVYGKNKKDAISFFWGEIERNENFKAFSRRDFKIEAERWDEGELDCNGNPMSDWSTAISVCDLHLIRFNHCTGEYELADKPQESSEPVAQENIQPELEDATESISEPQRSNRWNVSVFFSKDQILDELWRLRSDLSSGDVVGCTKRHEHQMNRFIKALDVAIDCINEIDELSQRASESLLDENKEIINENAEELTESNPEPLGDIKISDFFSITEMLLMENSEPEWAYYHNNDLIWASSKRFSKDELLRMYANGYFMPYLTDKRKNLSRIQLKEYKTMGNTERCQNLWKQIEALDEEIARLFMNGARM